MPPLPIASPIIYRLGFDADKSDQGTFSVCTGIGSSSEVIIHPPQQPEAPPPPKIPRTPADFPNLVLERQYTPPATTMWAWRKLVIDGEDVKMRKTGTIAVIDGNGTTRATWRFQNGWPCGWSLVPGAKDGTLHERVEIAHEGVAPA